MGNIRCEPRKGYVFPKITDDNYAVCRIPNEYDNLENAENDLDRLLSKKYY